MNNLPLVSILIPLYNHEQFIEKLLDSILEDSYENKEIILINDGSKDKSDEVVKNWITRNKNVNINYLSRENKGLHKTLNELISLSNGKYILNIASDDYLINDTISKRVEVLEKNQSKLMLISDCIAVDDNNNTINNSTIEELHYGNKSNYFTDEKLKNEILYKWSIVGPSYMLNKKIYDLLGYYDPAVILEDWDYAVRAVSENLILFYDEKVAAYRLHDNNTIKNENAAIKFSESCIKTIDKYGHKFSLKDRLRLWNKARKLKRKVKKLKLKMDKNI